MYIFFLFLLLFPVFCRELNPYKVLSVPRSATQKQIKSAYKNLARKYHPDKNGDKHTKKMQEISLAYDTLKDPRKKREYDNRNSFRRRPFGFDDQGQTGMQLTANNYQQVLSRTPDITWLIFVYSTHQCRTCESARLLFEDICFSAVGPLIKCARINRDDHYSFVISTLGIRRLPTFIVKRNKYRQTLLYKHQQTDKVIMKNFIDIIYDKKEITQLRSGKDMRKFLTTNIHITRIIVFSTKGNKPHVFLRHIAATFPKEVKLGFVYNSNKDKSMELRKLLHVENEDGSVLVVVNSVLPFHSSALHSELELGLYSKDVSGLIEAVKQRIEPDLALLDYHNFVDLCFKSYGKLDKGQICFAFLFRRTVNDDLKSLVTQIANEQDVRMAAVDCQLQASFCQNLGFSKTTLVAISGPLDKFVQYKGDLSASSVKEWMKKVSFSIQDLNPKNHCGFPSEKVDSLTAARRELGEKFGPIGEGFAVIWSYFTATLSNISWLVETFFSLFFSLIIPLILFGSFFLQRR